MNKGEKVGNKYWFSASIPNEVKSSCKDILLKHEYLIPSWCNEVRIYWNPEGSDSEMGSSTVSAYIETSYAYRFASLSICPPYLSEEEEDREVRIRHELCHIVSFPVVTYIRDVANIMGVDETLGQLITREITEKIEAMTEDLAQIVTKMEAKILENHNKK